MLYSFEYMMKLTFFTKINQGFKGKITLCNCDLLLQRKIIAYKPKDHHCFGPPFLFVEGVLQRSVDPIQFQMECMQTLKLFLSVCFRKCSVELSTSPVDEKINTNRLLTGYDLTMDCVKSLSELESVQAKKWTGKSLTKAGLSHNFSRQDLAWIGLYLKAYRSRVRLDRLKLPFSHTSLGRVLDKNQPGSQLEYLNHLLIFNCQYLFFLCPMCVLCSVMCDVWIKHQCKAKTENPLFFVFRK